MVRISDARMSGTAFGTIVLHIVPEAAVGGPLALVRTGDRIQLDVAGRRIDLLVDEAEMALRRAAWTAPADPPGADRGYLKLYRDNRDAGGQGVRLRLPGGHRAGLNVGVGHGTDAGLFYRCDCYRSCLRPTIGRFPTRPTAGSASLVSGGL